jgi:hypothetical protein
MEEDPSLLRKETAMDVFEFVQYLQIIDDILVTAVCAAFVAVAGYTYPDLKRVACRVLVKANQRDKYYRGYRG